MVRLLGLRLGVTRYGAASGKACRMAGEVKISRAKLAVKLISSFILS